MICLAGQVNHVLAYTCNNNDYVNSSGDLVHSPSCGAEHEKRTAGCRDGSVSYSEHHRGTCSYHGGVAHWDRAALYGWRSFSAARLPEACASASHM